MHEGRRGTIALLLCALMIALALRAPLLESHVRYLDHEDDAHHFNRTVEMAQRGDLNPHYFNKPAFHFYIRMPVVWASAAWLKLQGHLESLGDVRTRDPFGLAGYAFTASHPSILAWNRWFSVLLSLGLVAGTFALALAVGLSRHYALTASLLVGVSPEVLINSDVIGVDIPMALLCLLTTVFGVLVLKGAYSRPKLLLCGVLAGLAGATKYNAAPIAIVPLLLAWYRDRSVAGLCVAILGPLAGYLCGAPYSVISWGEFWSGLSYEVWHYSVSGHEGHSASPGAAQLLFYLSWLQSDGVGLVASCFACVGLVAAIVRRRADLVLYLSFPVAYGALMVAQKTNFTRNMVSIVPYVAVATALGISQLVRLATPRRRAELCAVLLSFGSLIAPTIRSTEAVVAEARHPESRDILAAWLESRNSTDEVGIAGALQIPPYFSKDRGVVVIDGSTERLADLVQQGFTALVLPSAALAASSLPFGVVLQLPGEPLDKHSPRNPAISIVRVSPHTVDAARKASPASISLSTHSGAPQLGCATTSEPYCWLYHRETTLTLPAGISTLSLEARTPWAGQELSVLSETGVTLASSAIPLGETWTPLTIPVPQSSSALVIRISEIHAPLDQGLNADPRRLGVAIRVSPH